jgi:ion channel
MLRVYCFLVALFCVAGGVAIAFIEPGDDGTYGLFAALILSISLPFEFFVLRAAEPSRAALAPFLVSFEFVKVLFGTGYWLAMKQVLAPWFETTLAAAALVTACVIMIWSFWLASVVASVPPDLQTPTTRGEKIVHDFRRRKIEALCCMIVAFLHTDYFLTFSLALHDKAESGFALYATIPNVVKTVAEVDLSKLPLAEASCGLVSPDPSRRVWKFFFRESHSDMSSTENEKAEIEKQTDGETTICSNEALGRVTYLRALPHSHYSNLRQLYDIKRVFAAVRKQREYAKLSVEIRGHAGRDFAAGHQLASDRAGEVKRLIWGEFNVKAAAQAGTPEVGVVRDGVHIENKVPELVFEGGQVGTEEVWLDPRAIEWANAAPLNRKNSVEVKLSTVKDLVTEATVNTTRRRELTLLDYSYFMLYTITTTGYGDLVPMTGFAKFVTSVANFFELLFLIVVFNSLFNLQPPASKVVDEDRSGGVTKDLAPVRPNPV